MRTVAIRAGVSCATVSRVLQGSPLVRMETAERVRKVIAEIGFIPNLSATALKSGRSNTYGLIIPDLTNPFFPEFVLEFEQVLVASDREIMVASTQSSPEKLSHSVRRMLFRRVDGIVLMASEYDTRTIEPILDHRIPIVTIDRRHAEPGCGDVAIDFEDGYRQAVLHLKALGHRAIGFIGGTEGLTTSRVRLEAFQKALQEAQIRYRPNFLRAGDYRVSGGKAAMRSLLRAKTLPTAVLTVNDLTAFGVLRALHGHGIGVPSQMSVVGFDGIHLSDAVYPSLTTISVSRREMASRSLQVFAQLKDDISKKGLLFSVPVSLIVRESTGPAPAGKGRANHRYRQ